MNKHQALWNQITQFLNEARACLPPELAAPHSGSRSVGLLTGTLSEFEEFLEHNELELAWDALAAVAEHANAPAACWDKLAQAADAMQLPAKARIARNRNPIDK